MLWGMERSIGNLQNYYSHDISIFDTEDFFNWMNTSGTLWINITLKPLTFPWWSPFCFAWKFLSVEFDWKEGNLWLQYIKIVEGHLMYKVFIQSFVAVFLELGTLMPPNKVQPWRSTRGKLNWVLLLHIAFLTSVKQAVWFFVHEIGVDQWVCNSRIQRCFDHNPLSLLRQRWIQEFF
jgi:hypothetical protein